MQIYNNVVNMNLLRQYAIVLTKPVMLTQNFNVTLYSIRYLGGKKVIYSICVIV